MVESIIQAVLLPVAVFCCAMANYQVKKEVNKLRDLYWDMMERYNILGRDANSQQEQIVKWSGQMVELAKNIQNVCCYHDPRYTGPVHYRDVNGQAIHEFVCEDCGKLWSKHEDKLQKFEVVAMLTDGKYSVESSTLKKFFTKAEVKAYKRLGLVGPKGKK